MGSISESYATEGVNLPVINISRPSLEVGKQMLDAATKYGFLYIDTEGTGFTEEIVDREFDLSQKFFALSDDEKGQYPINGLNRGWTGMHKETLDPAVQKRGDFKEALNIGEFLDGKPQQGLPPLLVERQHELYDFEKLCIQTCNKILDLLAIGLEADDPQFFSSRHTKPSGCTLRFLKYPAMADALMDDYDSAVDIRAGAHSDYGSLTLLFQRAGQPGLEIRTQTNVWSSVAVSPPGYTSTHPPILVNIADLLSYWTNGLLKSTVHRVIFPHEARKGGEDRYSIVFFSHPASATRLVPVPSRIVREHKEREAVDKGAGDGEEAIGYGGGAVKRGEFEAITAHEHLLKRLEATYGFKMDAPAGK